MYKVTFNQMWQVISGGFARNVALITSGAVLAQFITLLAATVLTRLFSAEAFGMLGLFTAIVGLLISSANLRYELPVLIARVQSQAIALVYLCLLLVIVTTVLLTIAVFLWGKHVANFLGSPQLLHYLPWISVYVFFSGVFAAFNQWATRQREFTLIASNPVIRASVTVAIQLFAGVCALSSGWLIFGLVAGQAAAAVSISWPVWYRYRNVLQIQRHQCRRIALAAKRFRRFPLYSVPQGLLSSISQQMPNFILAIFFGTVTVGVYWLAVRVLQMPANIVGQAARQVFYQRISEVISRGDCPFVIMLKATVGLWALGAFAFLPIIFFGPFFFSFIFGEVWLEAGAMARWVALSAWLIFTTIPVFCGLQAMGAQRELLAYEVVLFISRSTILIIFAIAGSPLQTVAAYSFADVVFNVGLISYGLLRAARHRGILRK